MIRIAIIAGVLHAGGKRNLIMEYYRHIDRNKVQFDFICDSDSNGIPEAEIIALGGRVFIVPPYKNLLPHLNATYKILRDNKYGIVHAFDNTLNVFPMFLAKLAGVKVRISESISKGNKNEKKSLVKYVLRPFSHLFANYYMANSIDCGVWQFGRKSYDDVNVDIFKSIIDVNKNKFDKSIRDKVRKDFGLNGKIVYGFIGRYVAQKNPLFLIDIFNAISKKQDNAYLVLIGFGDMEREMMDKVSLLGISDRVINLGRREDIALFYNAFDAFLLPSLYEGMPVVGIEAQCFGLPVFFSENITKETTASDLAHYIGLDKSADDWADYVISAIKANQSNREEAFIKVIANGFDCKNESMRLQRYYEEKLLDK